MTTKQLERMSKKAEKDESSAKLQVKKALEKHNQEGARIYAENAIRKKTEALNFLRMASRMDAVSSRVQTAMSMKEVTKNMGSVVHGLDAAMKSMDLVQLTTIMDKFEKQFQDLDTHAAVMEGAMSGATTLSTPEDQVEALMQQVADEHGMDIQAQLHSAGVGSALPTSKVGSATHEQDDELSKRLAALRG